MKILGTANANASAGVVDHNDEAFEVGDGTGDRAWNEEA